MKSTLSLLLVFLNHYFMPRHNAQLRLLKAQIAILRARIPTQRIIPGDWQRTQVANGRAGSRPNGSVDCILSMAAKAAAAAR